MSLRTRIGEHPIMAFVLIAFLHSWTAWAVVLFVGGKPGVDVFSTVFWLAGGFGPPVAGLIVTGVDAGRTGMRELLGQLLRWNVPWRYYGIAILLPGFFVVAVVGIDFAVRGVWTPPPDREVLGLLGLVFVINTLVTGGPEEIGWRGFMLPLLQRRLSALTASLVLGSVWMIWHAPLFLLPGTTQLDWPIVAYVTMGLASTIVFTWLYNTTGGGLLFVVLLHGSFNTWLSSVWILRDGIDPISGWVFAGVIVATAFVLVMKFGGKHLATVPRQTTSY